MLWDSIGDVHGVATHANFGWRDGTPTASLVDGVLGGSFGFKGDWQGVEIWQAELSAPWTLSVWVKRTGNYADATLLGSLKHSLRLQQGNSTNMGFSLHPGAEFAYCFRTCGDPSDYSQDTDYSFGYRLPLNEWVHITIVSDNDSTDLYANGVKQQGSIPGNLPLPLRGIGKHPGYWSADARAPFVGLHAELDEMVVWDEVLSEQDIVAQARFYRVPYAGDRVHDWGFGQVSGGVAVDVGLLKQPAVVRGASLTTVNAGDRGRYLAFDGVNDYLSTDADAVSYAGGWTAALWVRRTQSRDLSVLFGSDQVNKGFIALQQRFTSNEVGVTTYDGSSVVRSSFDYSVPLNTWVHLVFVGDVDGTKLYANGVLQGSVDVVLDLPLDRIGAYNTPAAGFAAVGLDDISIFSRALVDSEIAFLYGVLTDSSDYTHHWSFDDGAGFIATNTATPTKPGILTGGASWTQGRDGAAVSI
ncbi:MAG: LamG domain-containing protein, partial [Acidimicrobiia bacterium]|nr:LamG domain-containing protein [Acidimicrobiia bacterium]